MIIKPSFALFTIYLKNLISKWILWLCLSIDFIAVIVQVFIPSLTLPHIIYILIAVIGLIWSGFLSYIDILAKLPKESTPVQPEPKLAVFLIEGNEYSYKLSDTAKETRPTSNITIHIRVENIGDVKLKLLTVAGDFSDLGGGYRNPLAFMIPNAYDPINDKSIPFPLVLGPNDKLNLDIVDSIHPAPLLNDAQT